MAHDFQSHSKPRCSTTTQGNARSSHLLRKGEIQLPMTLPHHTPRNPSTRNQRTSQVDNPHTGRHARNQTVQERQINHPRRIHQTDGNTHRSSNIGNTSQSMGLRQTHQTGRASMDANQGRRRHGIQTNNSHRGIRIR